MENYTVILQGKFRENYLQLPEFEEYIKRQDANREVFGGIVKAKYFIDENLEQNETPSFVIIVDFPSKDAAINAYTSEEYLSIIPLREIAFKEVKILFTK